MNVHRTYGGAAEQAVTGELVEEMARADITVPELAELIGLGVKATQHRIDGEARWLLPEFIRAAYALGSTPREILGRALDTVEVQ